MTAPGVLASVPQRWVALVCRRAGWVLLLALLSVAAALHYASGHLGVDSSTTDMFSSELPWRQADAAYRRAFPHDENTILAVLDAPTAEQAEVARDALADALAGEAPLFESVYRPGGGEFFARQGLLILEHDDLEELVSRIAAAQPVLGRLAADPSLRGVLGLIADATLERERMPGIDLRFFLTRVVDALEAGLAGRDEALSWREVMAGQAAGPEDRRAYLVMKPRLDFSDPLPAAAAIRAVRDHARRLGFSGEGERGVRIRLSGGAALSHEELESVSVGARSAGALALVGVALVLAWGLRSWRLGLAAIFSLAAGLVWTLWFAAWAIGHLNVISVAFAVLYIGLGIDYAIHYCLRYRELVHGGHETAAALGIAAGDTGGSLVICALTTGIGFYAFVPTAFSGVSELGLISGTGMFVSLLATLTLLPACLRLLPLPAAGASAAGRPATIPRAPWERRFRWPVLFLSVAVSATAAVAAVRVEFDYNLLALKDPRSESVATYLELMAQKGRAPWTIVALASEPDEAERLAERLQALPSVAAVWTIRGFAPRDTEERLAQIADLELLLSGSLDAEPEPAPGDSARLRAADGLLEALEAGGGATPLDRRLVAALRELRTRARGGDAAPLARAERNLVVTLGHQLERLRQGLGAVPLGPDELPEELRRRWVSPEGAYRLRVEPREDLNDNAALARFVAEVRAFVPDAVGTPVIYLEASRAVIAAFEEAFTYAFILIALILALTLRRPLDVALVLGLVLLGNLLATGALVTLGLSFNFANVIALPLLLGIGVDNGVHMLHRMRNAPPARGGFLSTSTARAVLASAGTTICGFGSLAVSAHQGMASMGILLSLGLGFSLLCTLVVLPVVVQWRADAGRRRG